AALPLSGTAMLSGTVRGTGDAPLASAEVRVRGASAMGKTDASGRYSLSGLPAGTQVLDVRRVGYGAAEMPVELRSGVTITGDVRMQRIVNLDSIRVVGSRSHYKEFNEQQKHKIFGVFLGPEEMAWRSRTSYASDVIKLIPGYQIVGEGRKSQVVNGRGGGMMRCRTNIVIDGMEGMSINDVEPIEIGVIAAYRMGDQGPPEYDRGCGAIIIWTKR
ncbi:MAG: carboxypeptidase-like regulatory domain-containing protein, partial [Gemmatimonadaceae bacterium]